MITANAIKEKYASMHDGELIKFAEEERNLLPIESLKLLETELAKRKLDKNFIYKNGPHIVEGDIENSRDIAIAGRFPSSAWSYTFDQKEAAKSNEEIITGLSEIGMDEADALILLSSVETVAKTKLKKAELDKLTGGLISICGIAITFLPIQPGSSRLIYIFAGCSILFGAGRFIKGMYYKTRFKKVLENVSAEHKK